jgi:hypothetical protein
MRVWVKTYFVSQDKFFKCHITAQKDLGLDGNDASHW